MRVAKIGLKGTAERTTPLADWSGLDDYAHAVQFYMHEDALVDRVVRLVGPTVVLGGAAIVVATRRHRTAIAKRLGFLGLDLRVPRGQGRYITLDAAAAAASLVRKGSIDQRRFLKLAGKLLDAAAAAGQHRRISVFGEIVAVLWERGQADAAIELEELWQGLAKSRKISVCCAYPLNQFSGLSHAIPFMKICSRHTHVFPAEHTPTGR